jgi:5-methylcytosine-specific restriction endonuclease McrA
MKRYCVQGHDTFLVGRTQSHSCKQCVSERSKQWQQLNPERVRQINKRYHRRHSKERNLRSRLWKKRNSTKVKAYQRHWYLLNQDKKRFNGAKRRALKRKVSLHDSATVRKIYSRARELRKWFDVVVDHITPLSKGGAHSPKNLQIIYAFENARKGDSLTYKPQVIFK